MKAIKSSLQALGPAGDTGVVEESTLAPLRSRTGMLWLAGSLLSLAIGAWLLVAGRVLGVSMSTPGALSEQVVGGLAIVVSLLSLGRRTRPVRMAEAALGGWLLISAWFLESGTSASRWNATAMALLLIVVSGFLGKRRGV
jgi:hypothetical protein